MGRTVKPAPPQQASLAEMWRRKRNDTSQVTDVAMNVDTDEARPQISGSPNHETTRQSMIYVAESSKRKESQKSDGKQRFLPCLAVSMNVLNSCSACYQETPISRIRRRKGSCRRSAFQLRPTRKIDVSRYRAFQS
jgi:uncharacterized Fe-S radical SAM superfamily protein PflX